MKSIAQFASLLFATATALSSVGCGSIDAETAGAEYPQQPVGYDQPEQSAASSNVQSIQATPSPASAAEVDQRAAAERAQSAQSFDGSEITPQQGDVAIGTDAETYGDTDPSALSDFRPALDPYGTWNDDPTYGTVWTPSPTVVGSDFAPYVTAGHWAYEDDYTWVSNYDWGWAPFHYGRWVYIGGRGWGWIPGRQYAGAWVSWRTGYDGYGYVGWAPMPPTWYWRGGIAVGIGFVPPAPYVFCGSRDVFSPTVGSRLVAGSQVPVVASHTHPYVPANPQVGGSGGGVAGGRVGAHPTVGGPPPSSIGLSPQQVAHVPPGDRGVQHAQQFANASTAQTLGARAPVQSYAHLSNATVASGNVNRSGFASPGVPRSTMPARMPAYGNSAVVSAPQYRGIAPQPYHAAPSYSSAPSYSRPASPSYASPQPHYGQSAPSYSAPHYATPSYSAPHMSTPSYSAPAYHAPVVTSHPTYSAPAPVSRPSGGGFHGGGGMRGGGGRR